MDRGTSAAGANAGDRPLSIQRGRQYCPEDSGPVSDTCGASQAGRACLAGWQGDRLGMRRLGVLASGGCGASSWRRGGGWPAGLACGLRRLIGFVRTSHQQREGSNPWDRGGAVELARLAQLAVFAVAVALGRGGWRAGEGPNRPGALQRRSAVLFRSIAHSILTAGDSNPSPLPFAPLHSLGAVPRSRHAGRGHCRARVEHFLDQCWRLRGRMRPGPYSTAPARAAGTPMQPEFLPFRPSIPWHSLPTRTCRATGLRSWRPGTRL